MTQIDTPTWILPRVKPANYETALASRHATQYPATIAECRAGMQVKVSAGRFFQDHRSKLWLNGEAPLFAVGASGADLVTVERVEEGVRVLRWPNWKFLETHAPNEHRYVPTDLWVVDFPYAKGLGS